jgi:hypothetical protein
MKQNLPYWTEESLGPVNEEALRSCFAELSEQSDPSYEARLREDVARLEMQLAEAKKKHAALLKDLRPQSRLGHFIRARRAILAYLDADPKASWDDIAKQAGCAVDSAKYAASQMARWASRA